MQYVNNVDVSNGLGFEINLKKESAECSCAGSCDCVCSCTCGQDICSSCY